MHHNAKRLGLAVLGAGAIGCFLGAAFPRIIAWNDASNAATIAMQRASNCRVLKGSLQANTIPLDVQSKRPLPAGSHVCDWNGNTGQINGTGAIDFVKIGQTEAMVQALKARGFRPPD